MAKQDVLFFVACTPGLHLGPPERRGLPQVHPQEQREHAGAYQSRPSTGATGQRLVKKAMGGRERSTLSQFMCGTSRDVAFVVVYSVSCLFSWSCLGFFLLCLPVQETVASVPCLLPSLAFFPFLFLLCHALHLRSCFHVAYYF